MSNQSPFALAPKGPVPMPIMFWAGVFTLMMSACVGMMAVTYRR